MTLGGNAYALFCDSDVEKVDESAFLRFCGGHFAFREASP